MEKDPDLERRFDEYFDGVQPTDTALDNAKKLMQKRARRRKLIRRIVPAFSAAAVAVGAVVLVVNINSDRDGGVLDDGSASPAPAPAPVFTYYADASLSSYALDPYSAELPDGLGFVKALELANNADVYSLTAYADEHGDLSLVRADIHAAVGATRHDATVYVEYTRELTVYEPLSAYYDGETIRGATVARTETDGEFTTRALAYLNGRRYYISVVSSEKNAYSIYLELIKKNI